MFFKDVAGQESIKKKLIDSVRSGRIAHAQLFAGQSGYGGLPLALAYARYINCHNPGEEDACGECDACKRGYEYPDLHFSFPVINKKTGGEPPVSDDLMPEWRKALKESPYVDYNSWMAFIEAENKQGKITAKECRAIIKKLTLKPLYEGYKVMIIWMPELMGKEANMLLKMLEEPQEKTLFLLVTEDEEKNLPTILSRTQILRIPRIDDGSLVAALVGQGLSAEEAGRIAGLAEGDHIKALKLIKEAENNYTDEFIQWMRLCYIADMAGVLKWVDNISTTGRENQKHFLLNGTRLLRECLLAVNGVPALGRYMPGEKDFVEKFSIQLSGDSIGLLSEEFSKGFYYIERNVNPKILFFNLSLKITEMFRRRRKRA